MSISSLKGSLPSSSSEGACSRCGYQPIDTESLTDLWLSGKIGHVMQLLNNKKIKQELEADEAKAIARLAESIIITCNAIGRDSPLWGKPNFVRAALNRDTWQVFTTVDKNIWFLKEWDYMVLALKRHLVSTFSVLSQTKSKFLHDEEFIKIALQQEPRHTLDTLRWTESPLWEKPEIIRTALCSRVDITLDVLCKHLPKLLEDSKIVKCALEKSVKETLSALCKASSSLLENGCVMHFSFQQDFNETLRVLGEIDSPLLKKKDFVSVVLSLNKVGETLAFLVKTDSDLLRQEMFVKVALKHDPEAALTALNEVKSSLLGNTKLMLVALQFDKEKTLRYASEEVKQSNEFSTALAQSSSSSSSEV